MAGELLFIGWIVTGEDGSSWSKSLIRITFGILYILFIPGYSLHGLLFPRKKDLDNIERITLSFILSIVILSPIALLLNRLPWGINTKTVVISMSIFTTILVIAGIWRRARIAHEERFEINLKFNPRVWWSNLERTNRIVYADLLLVIIAASITAFSILAKPQRAENFTEFYIRGANDTAEYYLRELTQDEPETVTVGINNQEGIASVYNVLVLAGDQLVGKSGPIRLDKNTSWEGPVQFSISKAGRDQQIIFILDREGQPSPYRTLRLWLNVNPSVSQ